MDEFIQKFDNFSKIYEDSNLIKLGVPVKLAKHLHSLPKERKEDSSLRQFGSVAYTTHPVAHDIDTSEKIKGKSAIIRFLHALPTGQHSMLLIGPNDYTMKYISYKSDKVRGGNQYRIISIDPTNGDAIGKWGGTLGQLLADAPSSGMMLFVFEKEERAASKKITREKNKIMTDEEFINYFIGNYSSTLKSFKSNVQVALQERFYKMLAGISPKELTDLIQKSGSDAISNVYGHERKNPAATKKMIEIIDLAAVIEKDVVDVEQIKDKLTEFLIKLGKSGDYKKGERQKADLNDAINKHALMGFCTLFLYFIATSRVLTSTMHKNIFSQMGISGFEEML